MTLGITKNIITLNQILLFIETHEKKICAYYKMKPDDQYVWIWIKDNVISFIFYVHVYKIQCFFMDEMIDLASHLVWNCITMEGGYFYKVYTIEQIDTDFLLLTLDINAVDFHEDTDIYIYIYIYG